METTFRDEESKRHLHIPAKMNNGGEMTFSPQYSHRQQCPVMWCPLEHCKRPEQPQEQRDGVVRLRKITFHFTGVNIVTRTNNDLVSYFVSKHHLSLNVPPVSASLSARRASKVSLGISAKASFVGANTVKGPSRGN